ncbi:DUF2059 domain-containing protein [Gellertiella hungarica]|uniref:DUF2059 domain-containing protein n=1 Tax=Gellertiella hungarica TaxID=1572859 RepID=A0A7W6J4C5_9HYPH|nr:DUF2059 domain-containing protein [Gellertiella hungarica]MBB4064579.1 hypothetical protein [Gellertiella hungarica]
MITLAGFGRWAAATILVSAIAFGSQVRADDAVTEEQLKAARAAIAAINATAQFDAILPNLAEQLKNQLIQATPNYQGEISAAVDEEALALAARRGDLEKEAATIYAKTFTVDELNAITAFYTSPAGKKLLSDGPIATREMAKAADIWAAGISRDLATETDKKLEEVIGKQKAAEPAQQ